MKAMAGVVFGGTVVVGVTVEAAVTTAVTEKHSVAWTAPLVLSWADR